MVPGTIVEVARDSRLDVFCVGGAPPHSPPHPVVDEMLTLLLKQPLLRVALITRPIPRTVVVGRERRRERRRGEGASHPPRLTRHPLRSLAQ